MFDAIYLFCSWIKENLISRSGRRNKFFGRQFISFHNKSKGGLMCWLRRWKEIIDDIKKVNSVQINMKKYDRQQCQRAKWTFDTFILIECQYSWTLKSLEMLYQCSNGSWVFIYFFYLHHIYNDKIITVFIGNNIVVKITFDVISKKNESASYFVYCISRLHAVNICSHSIPYLIPFNAQEDTGGPLSPKLQFWC